MKQNIILKNNKTGKTGTLLGVHEKFLIIGFSGMRRITAKPENYNYFRFSELKRNTSPCFACALRFFEKNNRICSECDFRAEYARAQHDIYMECIGSALPEIPDDMPEM